MKFSDGYWNVKEEFTLHNPVEVRDVVIKKDSLEVFASTKTVDRRGDTLNTAQITVELASPIPDIIGVKIYHHKGIRNKDPHFQINKNNENPIEITNNDNEVLFTTGKLTACIKKENEWSVSFSYDGRHLTGSRKKSTAYITGKNKDKYVREQFELAVGECVYGLGERFTHFVKNGQVVDIWNEDGGTRSEQSYKNIPFYLTNKGYGILVNHPERVSFEVASEDVSKVQFSVPGESLEYFIIGGDSLKKVISNYTVLTGKPALPPAWSFGLWLTTSFTTSYDENTVNSFIDGMIERDIPLHVFHFDCFWMKEFQWCDFKWDPDVFPNPEEMLRRLKEKGLKICVWINPYIAQKSYLFDEGMENGYLVLTKDGDIWQWDRWQAGMGLVDFTNPDAVIWYQEKLKALLDMGVDCFKTDFGERIPTDVRYFNGADPIKMHNYYTFLYNKAVFELLERERGKQDAVLFARSATAGGQQFPVHWGGDCSANYPSMAETLRGGLSLCMSGFSFWSHDISGFERTASPDIYKRWTAFGLLSTHSRLHGNESYRVPWLFDEEAVDVLRFFTKLKCRLMPYLYSSACTASETGIPVMRAMVLEFPSDPACDYLDRQYMLGDSLLIAPVFSESGVVRYYLPKGTWTHFMTGEKIEGGCWKEERHDYMSLPMLVRENSIIGVGAVDTKPDYDYINGIVLHAFELKDGCDSIVTINDAAGHAGLQARIQRTAGNISISCNNSGKPWSVLLRGISEISRADGLKTEHTQNGTMIIPDKEQVNLHIEL